MEREVKMVAGEGVVLDADLLFSPTMLAEFGLALLHTPRSLPLRARYHDDPVLRAAGLTLRSRTEGEEEIAALKGPGPLRDGVRTRTEWEIPLASAPRVGEELPGALREVLATAGVSLTAWPPVLIETEILRVHAELALPTGGVAELAVDRGVVRAAGRSDRVEEIELEEVEECGPALLEAAVGIARKFGLRPSMRSKAARGLSLLGALRAPFRPMGGERGAWIEFLVNLEDWRLGGGAVDHEWGEAVRRVGAIGLERLAALGSERAEARARALLDLVAEQGEPSSVQTGELG